VVTVGISALALVAAACGKAQARVLTPAPPPAADLALPEPPPRLLIPVAVEPPAPPPGEKPVDPPARPPGSRQTTAPPPTPPPNEPPPPVLRTGVNLAALEARATTDLARAERDLARVSPLALSRDAREQYDSAQRFIRMAKEALETRNVVYAAQCADKAATLASLLVKSTDTLS
jgi:hypothetical protein